MKNRIISLILVICTVVLSVPVFMFPAGALTNPEYTTIFALDEPTTAPLYTQGVSFDGFQEPWTAGYMDRNGNYTQYHQMAKDYNILNGGNCWTETGLWLTHSRYILLDGGLQGGRKYSFFEENTTAEYAMAVRYVSPYEGTVDIGFDLLTCYDAELDTTLGEYTEFYLAIFKNGQMIWPATDGNFAKDAANADKWATIAKPDVTDENALDEMGQFMSMDRSALDDVPITVGDELFFCFARKGCRYVYGEPMITFNEGYTTIPSTLNATFEPNDKDWPAYKNGKGMGTLVQQSDYWTIGEIGATDTTFTPYPSYYREIAEIYACHAGNDYDTNGAVMLGSGTKLLNGSVVFGTASDYYSAFEYTAVATGKATIGYSNPQLVGLVSNNYAALTDGSTVKLAVFKNGEQVGSDVVVTAGATGVTAEFPTNVELTKGDKVVIAVKKDSASVVALSGSPLVSFTDIDSFMSMDTDDAYALNLEEVYVQADAGNFGLVFNAYATEGIYLDAEEVGMYVWGKDIAAADRTVENATKVDAIQNTTYAYQYVYSALDPKEMADVVAVQAYAVVMGQTYTSEVKEGSFADYAYDNYTETDDLKLQNLLVAMLNYGAYAQVYWNYNTASLANKDLPESLKAIDYETLYYASFDGAPTGNRICNTEIKSFSLAMNKSIDSVDLLAKIAIDPYELEYTMAVQWSFDKDLIGEADNTYQLNPEQPYFLVEDISVQDFSKVLYARTAVTFGRTRYYGYTFSYSVESYAARMVDSTEAGLADLIHAMMQFSKAYNAYNA